MKPLPAGIITGFEWLENPEDKRVYAMLNGKRLEINEVPKEYLRPFISEFMDDKEFKKKHFNISVPERFILYIKTYYARFDEIPDLDLETGKTNKEVNLDLILTEKQKEIIPYLSSGEKYSAIASKLNITTNTFLTHLKDIYYKTNVHSVRELLQMV